MFTSGTESLDGRYKGLIGALLGWAGAIFVFGVGFNNQNDIPVGTVLTKMGQGRPYSASRVLHCVGINFEGLSDYYIAGRG